jgi:hypothetical protein
MSRVLLALTPSWREGQLVLAHAAQAVGLCRDGGYQAVSSGHASAHLEGLARRDMARVRDFVTRVRLPRHALSDIDDEGLVALLRTALGNRELVVLRVGEGEQDAQSAELAAQRRLIREIDGELRRLSHAGRQYRLVADLDLHRLADRDSYEVVRRDDAVEILGAIAKQSGAEGAALGTLLARAQAKLTKDWRPPLHPSGLVLLRRIVVLDSHAPDVTDAITPSQLRKKLIKTEWIEIEVVDDLGEPYTGPYQIELPDGSIVKGNFDKDGLWGDYEIEPGSCVLVLPEVPETIKPGSMPSGATTWIAFKVVDDLGQPIEGRPYRLVLTDGTFRTGTTGKGEIRVDPIPAGTCVLFLDEAASNVVPAGIPENPVAPALPSVTPAGPPSVQTVRILDAVLQDDDGKPIPNYDFEVEFPDGTVKKGKTSTDGLIHMEDCPADQCTLRFAAARAA